MPTEPIIEIDLNQDPVPPDVESKMDLDHLVDFTIGPYQISDGTIFVGLISRGKTIAKNFSARPFPATISFGSAHIMAAQFSLHPGRGTIGVRVKNQFDRYAFGGFRNVDGFPIASTRVPVRGTIIKFMSSHWCQPR